MENSKDDLKGTYEAIVNNGTPTTMGNLIYLNDGLYLTPDGDIVEM